MKKTPLLDLLKINFTVDPENHTFEQIQTACLWSISESIKNMRQWNVELMNYRAENQMLKRSNRALRAEITKLKKGKK